MVPTTESPVWAICFPCLLDLLTQDRDCYSALKDRPVPVRQRSRVAAPSSNMGSHVGSPLRIGRSRWLYSVRNHRLVSPRVLRTPLHHLVREGETSTLDLPSSTMPPVNGNEWSVSFACARGELTYSSNCPLIILPQRVALQPSRERWYHGRPPMPNIGFESPKSADVCRPAPFLRLGSGAPTRKIALCQATDESKVSIFRR